MEQTIAGVKVGDRVSKAKQLYPALRWTRDGVWRAQIGRACMLEIVAGDAANLEAHVEVITLNRLANAGKSIGADCDAIRTGVGLRFGADLEEVKRRYPGIRLMEPGKEPSLYISDDGNDCLSGRTSVMRSMLLYWSHATQKIVTISLEASGHACEEYRATSPKR